MSIVVKNLAKKSHIAESSQNNRNSCIKLELFQEFIDVVYGNIA